jgi:hypothetical protein
MMTFSLMRRKVVVRMLSETLSAVGGHGQRRPVTARARKGEGNVHDDEVRKAVAEQEARERRRLAAVRYAELPRAKAGGQRVSSRCDGSEGGGGAHLRKKMTRSKTMV